MIEIKKRLCFDRRHVFYIEVRKEYVAKHNINETHDLPHEVLFGDINIGELFVWDDQLYMKNNVQMARCASGLRNFAKLHSVPHIHRVEVIL